MLYDIVLGIIFVGSFSVVVLGTTMLGVMLLEGYGFIDHTKPKR